MNDETYTALESILSGTRKLEDWPKRGKDKNLRQKVYRLLRSGLYDVREIHDPSFGQTRKRIVEKSSGNIIVRQSEASNLISDAFEDTKGEGARKLRKRVMETFSGLSRRSIQKHLNVMKESYRVRPQFQNKAPLRPIKASRVQERHQVDLVSMTSVPAKLEGDTYKYIMSVIDIFSRFLFLRPLQSKDSDEVAENLLDIYTEHGPPEILQSDQGTEFKGVVKQVCQALNVRIIKSSAYSPQTQGKDERSHRTWKEKLAFDLQKDELDFNWVTELPTYQQIYNESPHSSLGYISPFEVYFGRKPNREKNKVVYGQNRNAGEFEVLEENIDIEFCSIDMDEIQLKKSQDERELLRDKALEASNKAAQNMIRREMKTNPPSLYDVGDVVLVRLPRSKKTVKDKKTSLRGSCEGCVLEADHLSHSYFIEFKDPHSRKSKKRWFKVDDVTSLTKEEENERQRKVREKNGIPTAKQRVNEISSLDHAIREVMSFEQLRGDTMNIYFNNFLRTEEEALGGLSGFATTYFYPSLMLPVDHSKHAGDKTLWEYEQLFVPVNLPKENHWLLIVISIVKLCLFLYDSASCSKETYKSIFSNIKNKYIKEQLKWLPSEEREFYKEENWNECFPECPKQDNDRDCGIFTCLFAKHMSRNLQDDDNINLLDDDHRGEVATDLISLVSATKRITPSIFEWMTYEEDTPSPRIKLDEEVQKAGLTYRQPPTPMDGNCLFHAISDQLDRLGLPQRSAAKLRAEVVEYLKENPTTPDGGHLREFVRYKAWDSWLRRMSTSGE